MKFENTKTKHITSKKYQKKEVGKNSKMNFTPTAGTWKSAEE
jgi:hypothetical protein